MKVNIKSKQELNYETSGAVGFDFKSNTDYEIQPGETVMIETGTVIKVPEGYVLQICPRSSTFKKLGLIFVNGVGIIDQDYCGNNDTIKFPYYNLSNKVAKISKGDRIGQGLFYRVGIADFEYVEEMTGPDRGGFGTTGL